MDREERGERLDKYLANKLSRYSRNFLQKLIEDENILVNKSVRKSSYTVKPKDRIEIVVPESGDSELKPQNIPVDIIYQDEHIAVVNKPSGMVVHPAPGHPDGTLVNALLYHIDDLSGIGGVKRPGIVHRLDKDVSGTMVVAKNDSAHRFMSGLFKDRKVDKKYTAVVLGEIKSEKGVIEKPVARSKTDRKKMAISYLEGKRAVSEYELIEQFNGFSLIEVKIITGRTHQIRLHMSSLDHPIVGDEKYGNRGWKNLPEGELRNYLRDFPRIALHSKTLGFVHPSSGERVEYESEIPGKLRELLRKIKD